MSELTRSLENERKYLETNSWKVPNTTPEKKTLPTPQSENIQKRRQEDTNSEETIIESEDLVKKRRIESLKGKKLESKTWRWRQSDEDSEQSGSIPPKDHEKIFLKIPMKKKESNYQRAPGPEEKQDSNEMTCYE